ncbi:MAG: hypothetical protein EBX39_00455 [Actinobacteria bacterium]|nr:hypothetical protein [Actinomycetota bacterium]
MDHEPITSLIGVYDADGTVIGEITYWLGARLGRAHCALCDVTHGLFTERDSWRRWRGSLTIPFELFHRDDAPADVMAAAGELPVVVARTQQRVVAVMDRTTLEVCSGDLDSFVLELDRALIGKGLRLPD